jgi:hypothetical protein
MSAMSNDMGVETELATTQRFGWRACGLTLALHVAGLAVATWPVVLSFPWHVPQNPDVFSGLWVMRWYRSCLLEGRSIFFCPEIQHPVGVPLGCFTPLLVQSVIYFLCSAAIPDDAICWNIVWLVGMLLTSMGTSLLAWHLVGDRACAALAGLLAMLSGPMMIHALAQLELIYAGGFPLLLIAWMKLVDQPSARWLIAAASAYLLVAMSSGYYMVFALFPTGLYLVFALVRAGRRGVLPALRERLPWLLGMVGLTLPGLLILYSAQFWTLARGYPMERSRDEFDRFGAPIWSYVVPSAGHLLAQLLTSDPYATLGGSSWEQISYLGVVPIGLIAYAAIRRVRLRRAAFVWSAFALVIVLSLGSRCRIGHWDVSLPADWLWTAFPPIRLTRVPARFSMFAMVLGAVLAAAGLRHLLARWQGRGLRALVFTGLAAVAVADLTFASNSVARGPIPAPPGCYAFLKRHDPKGAILEIPKAYHSTDLNGLCSYWQSRHRLTTSAGISGLVNHAQDGTILFSSPFFSGLLANPHYLEQPGPTDLLLIGDVEFNDYLWLYLTVNRFEYIVLHQRPLPGAPSPERLDRVKTLLEPCKVYEDGASVVYSRTLLRPPSRPVPITVGNWTAPNPWRDRWNSVVQQTARIAVYNPHANREFRLSVDASSVSTPLSVRLASGERELARWRIVPGDYQRCTSPPIRLPVGVQHLTIASGPDGEVASGRSRERGATGKPGQLRVARLSAEFSPEPVPVADRVREDRQARGR